jgi:cation transport ATPase
MIPIPIAMIHNQQLNKTPETQTQTLHLRNVPTMCKNPHGNTVWVEAIEANNKQTHMQSSQSKCLQHKHKAEANNRRNMQNKGMMLNMLMMMLAMLMVMLMMMMMMMVRVLRIVVMMVMIMMVVAKQTCTCTCTSTHNPHANTTWKIWKHVHNCI